MGPPGAASRADADFVAAGRLFAETGQELEAVYTVDNRAIVAFASGDLPVALSFLDAATPALPAAEVPSQRSHRPMRRPAGGRAGRRRAGRGGRRGAGDGADPRPVHQAGRTAADRGQLRAGRGPATGRPGLGAGRVPPVPVAAQCLVAGQRRACWSRRATQAGPVSARLLREANRAAALLDALGSGDAAQAHLLAGRVALDLGRRDDAERHLAAAAGPAGAARRWRGPAAGSARRCEPRPRAVRAALLAACRRGLEVLDEHRLTLGASELRAQATAHGAELAVLAQRQAARARRPRLLLTWSERWRATALAVPAGAAARPTRNSTPAWPRCGA